MKKYICSILCLMLGPAGLGSAQSPDAGKVLFNGQDITQLPPNKRQLNTVFQK